MHTLIEGFDGTGKSTLAEILSVFFGCSVRHQSPGPLRYPEELELRSRIAIQTALKEKDLISDRWPLISHYCYAEEGSVTRISASLKIADVGKIIFCDVDRIDDLRIEPRPGDEEDRLQTLRIKDQAPRVLERYRSLMHELGALGHDVRRLVMFKGAKEGE